MVEVLIAIAVASSVLAISYSIMNRGILTQRANQERTEAVKIAQGQIELLKNHSKTGVGAQELINEPGGFCMASGSVVSVSGGAPNPTPADDTDFSDYPAACRNGIFATGILRQLVDGGVRYRVHVRWYAIDSGPNERVNEALMVYRLE